MKSFIEGIKKLEGYKDQIEHIEFLHPKKEETGRLETRLLPSLQQYLDNRTIKLYKHQTDAINLARKGENIVIATPTASGKTLAFNLPVFEMLSKDPNARALYIYPMKALANDQLNTLSIMEKETGISVYPRIYDGDTLRGDRKHIRDKARIILTNPYGLHYYIPWHHLWRKFYENLKFIIVDESHSYRGVFGSHVALLFRRINRICNYYGSDPQYILSSATIANPEEHSRKLTGQDFHIISEDSSESGSKSFIFWNPPYVDDDLTRRSTHQETRSLLSYCIREGFQTLCFANSRKMAELLAVWVKQDLYKTDPGLATTVHSYRAGYLPTERRKIERGLKQREISAVVTTNALELGIDIGSLDCVILSGYPGTVISTWQQAGRAGRLIDDSYVFLVAFQNPLDQYFMNHPHDFFTRNPENAVINLDNHYITAGHVMCAAKEIPLSEKDTEYFEGYTQAVNELSKNGLIVKSQNEWIYTGSPRPETRVKLNNISDQTVKVFHYSTILETMDITQAYREVHEGAILLHQGEPYRVKSLDLFNLEAHVEETDTSNYTEALKTIDISIKEKIIEQNHGIKTGLGKVDVTEYYTEYRIMQREKKVDQLPLNLPPLNFPSVGFWFTVPSSISSYISGQGLDFAGGLHAIEHAMIAISPLHAMCDPRDLGGVSTELHRDTKEPTIFFVYDGYKGGIGLSEKLYELLHDLFETTLNLIQDCKCEVGCPSCIYSSKCGNNNEPLDKQAAIVLLKEIIKKINQ